MNLQAIDESRGTSPQIGAAIRFLSWVWLGLVVGVSFVATPVKFTADSLSRPVALDVGRATFQLLNRLEWVLVLGLIALAWQAWREASRPRFDIALVAAVAAIVALQTIWLLPALNDRVATIIAGSEPPSSPLHTIFGAFEVTKVTMLAVIGARFGVGRPD